MNVKRNKLEKLVSEKNRVLFENGTGVFLFNQDRNGYIAIDIYSCELYSSGVPRSCCSQGLESGTLKECEKAIYQYNPNDFYFERCLKGSKNRSALALYLMAFIDFSVDFYTVSRFDVEALHLYAKKSGYKKPKNANGSLARYFYAHIQKNILKNNLVIPCQLLNNK